MIHAPSTLLPESVEQVLVGEAGITQSTAGFVPEPVSFRIIGILGEGGMGIVYRAVQDFPERVVALKVLRPTLWGSKATDRLHREVQILARLRHPGIAQLYTAGVMRGPGGTSPFLAMELVEGVAATEFVRGRATADRIQLAVSICDAVAYAHGEGVVHRDLKPANILVAQDGRIKVVDFGLASISADHPSALPLTEMGQFLGTPDYMSPEQALDGRHGADERSDVFSLGVILYELLAGRRPLNVSSVSVSEAIRMVQQEDPVPLRAVCPSAAKDLEIIASKAMAKDRHNRYKSAAALADDLRRYLDHRPIAARRASRLYRTKQLLRRHLYLSISSAVVVASLSVGMALSLHQAHIAETQKRHAQVQLAEAKVAQADMLLMSENFIAANSLYDDAENIFKLANNPSLRARLGTWELVSKASRPIRSIQFHDGAVVAAITPDDHLLATFCNEDGLLVADAITGRVRWQMPFSEQVLALRFSLNGQLLAAVTKNRVLILRSGGGELVRSYIVPSSSPFITAGIESFSLYMPGDGYAILEIAGNSPPTFLKLPPLHAMPTFDSYDVLWCVSATGDICRAMSPTWKMEKTATLPPSGDEQLFLGNDGQWVARDTGAGTEVFGTRDGKLLYTVSGNRRFIGVASDAPMVFQFDQVSGLIQAVNSDGQVETRIPTTRPEIAASGRNILALKGENGLVTIWQNQASTVIRKIVTTATATGMDVVSGNGAVAAVPEASSVEVLNTQTGRQMAIVELGALVKRVNLDRAGNILAIVTADDRLRFWNLPQQTFEPVAAASQNVHRLSLAPNGQIAVSCDERNTSALIWRKVDGVWVANTLTRGHFRFPQFSPDGSVVALVGETDAEIWEVGEVLRQRCVLQSDLMLMSLAFAGDRKLVTTLDSFGKIKAFSAEDGRLVQDLALPASRVSSISAIDGTKLLAVLDQGHGLSIYDEMGEVIRRVIIPSGGTLASGEGRLLVGRIGGPVFLCDFSSFLKSPSSD